MTLCYVLKKVYFIVFLRIKEEYSALIAIAII